MNPKSEKRLDAGWKTATLIGVIMGTGFAGATYLAKYKTADAAKAEHAELAEATAKVKEAVVEVEVDVQDIRYVNVRIEVSQQQISDQLKMISFQGQRSRSRADREEMRVLAVKTTRRGMALQKSYEQKPVVKAGGAKMKAGDPLAGLEGL
jgi:hypothetical protein